MASRKLHKHLIINQIYLRAGSLNFINGKVELNFSCDGSHYLHVHEFLKAAEARWFGR